MKTITEIAQRIIQLEAERDEARRVARVLARELLIEHCIAEDDIYVQAALAYPELVE